MLVLKDSADMSHQDMSADMFLAMVAQVTSALESQQQPTAPQLAANSSQ